MWNPPWRSAPSQLNGPPKKELFIVTAHADDGRRFDRPEVGSYYTILRARAAGDRWIKQMKKREPYRFFYYTVEVWPPRSGQSIFFYPYAPPA